MLFYALLALFLLLIMVVGIHEYGHYLAARAFGIGISRVSIGFGRPLFRYQSKKSGIEYVFAWLPLGGYVALLDGRQLALSKQQRRYAFDLRPSYQRIIVLLAGAAANVLFAVLAFSMMYQLGLTTLSATVASVIPQSVAEQAGFKAGDQLQSVNGWQCNAWSRCLLGLLAELGESRKVAVEVLNPSGETLKRSLSLRSVSLAGYQPNFLASIGIVPDRQAVHTLRHTGWSAIRAGSYSVATYAVLNLKVITRLLSGKLSPRALAGPLALIDAATMHFKQGLAKFLQFLGLFSIAVALVNLLPIPGLDGAQVLFELIGIIFKRPLSLAWQILLTRFGYAALFVIGMQLLANDLHRLAASTGSG